MGSFIWIPSSLIAVSKFAGTLLHLAEKFDLVRCPPCASVGHVDRSLFGGSYAAVKPGFSLV